MNDYKKSLQGLTMARLQEEKKNVINLPETDFSKKCAKIEIISNAISEKQRRINQAKNLLASEGFELENLVNVNTILKTPKQIAEQIIEGAIEDSQEGCYCETFKLSEIDVDEVIKELEKREELAEISNLDIDEAAGTVEFDITMYLDFLKSYLPEEIESIGDVIKHLDAYENKDLPARIYVHGEYLEICEVGQGTDSGKTVITIDA